MSDSPPRIELTVPRTTQYLGMVRKVVAMAAERVEFPPEEVDKIELAIDEACSNAVLYGDEAAAELRISVAIDEERFVVVMQDSTGDAFDFEGRGNFDLDEKLASVEHGGLGIYIIKNFMDEVRFEHSASHGNVLTMVKLRSFALR